MTAAFAPAPQTRFVPRTLALVPETVPNGGMQPNAVVRSSQSGQTASMATVHSLPVRPSPAVYRRRRLVALSILFGLVLGIASFVSQAEATPTAEGQRAASITIIVQPGDTLWGIASSLDPDGDPRRLIGELERIAGNGVLQPGQQLVIPGHVVGT